MCSRYFTEDEHTGARIDVRPCDETAVLASGQRSRVIKKNMFWGFHAAGGIIINVRSESASEKIMFRESLSCRRCAIPANGFYEWNKAGEKAVFEAGTGEKLYLAGLYRFEEEIPRFVILTTEPNHSVKSVHDRMPLILKQEQLADWLSEQDSYKKLLTQIPAKLKRTMEYEQQTFEFL